MNWSRGLFRLWIAIACLWIGVATAGLYQAWPEYPAVSAPAAEEKAKDDPPVQSRPAVKADEFGNNWWDKFPSVAQLAKADRREANKT